MVLVLVSKLKLIEVEFLSTGVVYRSDRDFPVVAFVRERCPLSLRRLGWWAIVAYFSAEPALPWFSFISIVTCGRESSVPA